MGGVLLDQPWRSLPDNNQEDLTFVKSYKPQNKEVKHLRILLHGPAGDGKSSFINAVDSVLQGRIAGRALTEGMAGTTFTKTYKSYKMKNGPDSYCSFIFTDTMGYARTDSHSVPVADIHLALRGHVEEGYKFRPLQKLTEDNDGYNSSPTLDDRVHVLVSVISAIWPLNIMSSEMVQNLKEVRLTASELGIPQLAILTKVDEACNVTNKNIKDAYKSKFLEERVKEFSCLTGIPKTCIFLVKNYDEDPNMTDDKDALILSALRQMVTFGEDFLSSL